MIDVEISIFTVPGGGLPAPMWLVEVKSTQGTARHALPALRDEALAAVPDLPPAARTWAGFLTALSPGAGRYSPGPKVLRQVGTVLFDQILGAEAIKAHLQDVEARAKQEKRPVQYLLEVEEGDALLGLLPLELAHDGSRFLFKQPRRPAFRVAVKREAANLRLGKRCRVLIATAHSDDAPAPSREDLAEHAAALVRVLLDAGYEVENLADASPKSLGERLSSGEPVDLLYLACHGQEDRDQMGLLLLREGTLAGTELGRLLEELTAEGRPLQAVMLCACSSAAPKIEDGTLGMAQWLADRNRAAAAIGFRGPVLVPWALAFSERLFTALSQGSTLEEAFSEARYREKDEEPQWPLPVLYHPRPDHAAEVRLTGRLERSRGADDLLRESLSVDPSLPIEGAPSRAPGEPPRGRRGRSPATGRRDGLGEVDDIRPLRRREALLLLSRVAWNLEEPPAAERADALALVERLGRSHLALRLAGATLRNLVSPAEYLASLGPDSGTSGQIRLSAVIDRSLRDLPPDDLAAFRALGMLPPAGATAQAVANALGKPLPEATRRLDRLVRHAIASWSVATGLYTMHPEIRRAAQAMSEGAGRA